MKLAFTNAATHGFPLPTMSFFPQIPWYLNMASFIKLCPFYTRDPSVFLRVAKPAILRSAERCPVLVSRALSTSAANQQRSKDSTPPTGSKS